MNSESLLEQFNNHCLNTEDCDNCSYNCKHKSDIIECELWFGYNKAIDDFQEWLKTQVAGIDTTTNEILVVNGDRWELAIDIFNKQLKEEHR